MELTAGFNLLAPGPIAGDALAEGFKLVVPVLTAPPAGRVDVPAMSCGGVGWIERVED